MKLTFNCYVMLLNQRDSQEIFSFGDAYNKAVSFLDLNIKKSQYKEGYIKLEVKKG